MIVALAFIAGAAIAALAVIEYRTRAEAAAQAAAREAAAAAIVACTLVVHTRKPDDQSYRGLFHGDFAEAIDSGWIPLRDAEYLHKDGVTAAGGLVRVPVVGISAIQQLEPVTEVTS